MVVYTLDSKMRPGHPIRRFDMVRKLLKRREVRVIGGGASKKPPVVVFLKKEFDYLRTMERKFIYFLDPGHLNLGAMAGQLKDDDLHVFAKTNGDSS